MESSAKSVVHALETLGVPLPQQQRSVETYRRILESARDCVVELGYSRSSTPEIARRAGVSHGNLFKRFPNKVMLLVAMVAFVQEDVRSLAAKDISLKLLNAPIRERVDYFVMRYWRFAHTQTFKAIDRVWYEAKTDLELRAALQPVVDADIAAADLKALFPHVADSSKLTFLTDVIYSVLESLVGSTMSDAETRRRLTMLAEMVTREIETL